MRIYLKSRTIKLSKTGYNQTTGILFTRMKFSRCLVIIILAGLLLFELQTCEIYLCRVHTNQIRIDLLFQQFCNNLRISLRVKLSSKSVIS